jgi:DeoR family transcriptional regulator, deoxyribose operon repressor
MNRDERLDYIMQTLRVSKGSSVLNLAEQLKVSHMTVRRDLSMLMADGQVKMHHGSVTLHPSVEDEAPEHFYSLITAGSTNPGQKRRIGELAASLIQPDDNLIVDCGSTTEYLAKNLPEGFPYTMLCYALNIASEGARRKNCRLMFSGGLFHENTLMFESPEGLEMIRNFRATKAFISASGASGQFGVTCLNFYERETKRTIIRSSMKKILLIDSSKFDVVRSDRFAEFRDFDEIITDEAIPEETADGIRRMGILLRIA